MKTSIDYSRLFFHPSVLGTILFFILSMGPHYAFSQNIYIVNSLDDFEDINLADQICADKFGKCTLRAAIQNANKSYLRDRIYFDLAEDGPLEILLEKALPGIIQPIVIDGRLKSNNLNQRNRVFINGINICDKYVSPSLFSSRSTTNSGIFLDKNSNGSVIRGLGFHSFYYEALWIDSDYNVIQDNYFGSLDSKPEKGNHWGIGIYGGKFNLIGGSCSSDRNYFWDNFEGIVAMSSDNRIMGNYFGVKEDGKSPIGNTVGISLAFGAKNCLIEKNLISGNTVGIRSSTSSSIIINNLIGTDSTGTLKIGNQVGIEFWSIGTENRVGMGKKGNLISGNEIGILVNNHTPIREEFNPLDENILTIQANKIGTDIQGIYPIGNQKGIVVLDLGGMIIGGIGEDEKNLVSGNLEVGIELINAFEVSILGNKIGTDRSGTNAIPNHLGVSIQNRIGHTYQSKHVIKDNLISGNYLAGISIGPVNSHVSIAGNRIGVSSLNMSTMPNQNYAIILESPILDNCIGGNLISEKNLIDGDILQINKKRQNTVDPLNPDLLAQNFLLGSSLYEEDFPKDFWKLSRVRNYQKIILSEFLKRPSILATESSSNLETYWYPSLKRMKDLY